MVRSAFFWLLVGLTPARERGVRGDPTVFVELCRFATRKIKHPVGCLIAKTPCGVGMTHYGYYMRRTLTRASLTTTPSRQASHQALIVVSCPLPDDEQPQDRHKDGLQ